MMLENLAFSVKLIFMHKNWYSQNPQAQLSSNMYISFRFISLLRPHCAPNDTQLTVFKEVEKTRRFYVSFSIQKLPLSLTHIIPFFFSIVKHVVMIMTSTCHTFNEGVQLIDLLSQHVCHTIANMSTNHKHKVESKKKKSDRNGTHKFAGFEIVQIPSVTGTYLRHTPLQFMQHG